MGYGCQHVHHLSFKKLSSCGALMFKEQATVHKVGGSLSSTILPSNADCMLAFTHSLAAGPRIVIEAEDASRAAQIGVPQMGSASKGQEQIPRLAPLAGCSIGVQVRLCTSGCRNMSCSSLGDQRSPARLT